jgi:uncharacterized membrane protein
MTARTTTQDLGRHVYGLGIIALALVMLAWGAFDSGQPVPKTLPFYSALVMAASVFLLATGASVEWRRFAAWGAGALAAYYALVVAVVMDGRIVFLHYDNYGAYTGIAEPVALAAGGLIIYAMTADIDAARAARLMHIGQIVFGVCAVFFGIAHFVYMNMTAPLIPKFLPPSQEFWGYATGVFHIAGGLAIIANVWARLAAILLTVMYASFTFMVHLPMVIANHGDHFIWSENAENIALIGVAWVVVDSLARAKA